MRRLADWRNAIREELAERHELSAYQKLTRELLDQVIADSSVPVDRDLLQDLAEDLYDDFLYDLEDSNMTLEKYCKRTGKNKGQIRAEKDAEAAQIIRQQSVLHAIANREHLTSQRKSLPGRSPPWLPGKAKIRRFSPVCWGMRRSRESLTSCSWTRPWNLF